VQIRLRQENDRGYSRTSALGYACKEMGNAWSRNVHCHNMSNARLAECRDAHLIVAGYNVFKKRTLLYPAGWKEVVSRYEHGIMWPLCTTMISCQKIRFMLLEGTYALSPKWLDATGNNGVDNVAAESYDNILTMLRWGLRTVYVNDVEQVLSRGRKATGSKDIYENRDTSYDNMTMEEMKRLNRVALYEWEAERSRLRNLEQHELTFEQVKRFDVEELKQRADELGVDEHHPAAAVGQLLENEQGLEDFDEEPLNDEEHEVVHGGGVRNAPVGRIRRNVGADDEADAGEVNGGAGEGNAAPEIAFWQFIQD
jgi:hypothetical protein